MANTFSSDWEGMLAFFDVHCVRCHAAGESTNPELPRDAMTQVVPFDPEASVLWRVVVGELAPLDLATMPLDGALLPVEQTEHVREWILLGAVGDGDLDGFDSSEDCDDTDPAVNSNADEVCDGRDNDCDEAVDVDAVDASAFFPDVDGDGFGAGEAFLACDTPPAASAVEGDCDDADPLAFPGADEACTDPVDRDCDGAPGFVDADLDGFAACTECDDADPAIAPSPTWFPDDDGDGAGAPIGAIAACDPPPGYVAGPDDCNDANPTVSPDEPELCNTIDDDCDGAVDEDDAIDPAAWFVDGDGDGFGAGVALLACAAPPGTVAFAGDCDDASAAFAPGAPETCTDLADFNCDGAVGLVDLDADGYASCLECDDANPAISPDAVEVCNGVDDDCDGDIDGTATDATAWYPDLDGDSFGDDVAPVVACVAPPLHVAQPGDSDDGDPPANPETVWFVDGDGDGFGAGGAVIGCVAPAGGVANATDCDDLDADSFPGAPETCTDPTDRNCDGSPGLVDVDADSFAACLDCDDLDPAIGDPPTWYPDVDLDGFGDDLLPAVACNAPAGHVGIEGDCADADAFVHPDALLDPTDGRDNDCDGTFDEDGPLSHAADIQPLWNASCTALCHENPSPSGGLDLAAPAYGRLVGIASLDVPAMDRFTPFTPEDSYVWHKLVDTHLSIGGAGVVMPKMAPALPESELALIEAWILGGALP